MEEVVIGWRNIRRIKSMHYGISSHLRHVGLGIVIEEQYTVTINQLLEQSCFI